MNSATTECCGPCSGKLLHPRREVLINRLAHPAEFLSAPTLAFIQAISSPDHTQLLLFEAYASGTAGRVALRPRAGDAPASSGDLDELDFSPRSSPTIGRCTGTAGAGTLLDRGAACTSKVGF